jgi:DNA-binding Lrp family transcriptional regulator
MNELKLLHLLENDPRISTADLADILNVTEDDVKGKMDELHQKKVICGTHTVINWDKTNEEVCEAIIEVSAKPEKGSGYDRIAETIARLPEVSDLYLMSGDAEYFVKVKGKTMREVAEFVGNRLATIDGVLSTATCFLLKKYKVDNVLMEFEEEGDDRIQIS